jgi:predicted patatin/cPLA2 family phospholipase
MLEHYRTALVVEGGAMRSVFSAGLLDGFLDRKFNPFDFFIGVSAGAANLAAFLADMPGRNIAIFRDYVLRRECINPLRFAFGGHMIDLDWLWQIADSKMPLNKQALAENRSPLFVCLTDLASGDAVYKQVNMDNIEAVIKASSALPLLYRDFPLVDGQPMTDGGVADSLPVMQAIRRGARHIMVIRARPREYRKRDTVFHRYIRWKLARHRNLIATMKRRIDLHDESIALIRQPPAGVSIIEICPPTDFRAGRLCRNRNALMAGYERGLGMTGSAIEQWESLEIASNCAAT